MNFEDETYVRLYKRKTVTSKLIGWEGRACLAALLVEVDRAGVLDLESMDPADALSAIADIPIDLARVGMARLLDREVVIVHEGQLFLPRFLEAQEAKQSDAQRQRDSRSKRAAKSGSRIKAAAVVEVAEVVTNRDNGSQDVTSSHTQSHAVTVGHSVLSCEVLSSAGDLSDRRAGLDGSLPEASDGLDDPAAKPEVTALVLSGTEPTKADKLRADAHWVFECWKQDTGHLRSKLDAKRESLIKARLRHGFSREQLRDAVVNRHNDPWLMGQNPGGKIYDGIQTLLRDAAQVERLLALSEAPTPPVGSGVGDRASDGVARQLARATAAREQEGRRALP